MIKLKRTLFALVLLPLVLGCNVGVRVVTRAPGTPIVTATPAAGAGAPTATPTVPLPTATLPMISTAAPATTAAPGVTAILGTPSPTALSMETPTLPPISIVQQFDPPGNGLRALAWGSGSFWAASLSGSSSSVLLLDDRMQTVDVYKVPTGVGIQAMVWASDSEFWTSGGANSLGIVVRKMKLEDKAFVLVEEPSSGLSFHSGPRALAWDGTSLWVAQDVAAFRIDPWGTVLDHFVFPRTIQAFAWDGELLWLATGPTLEVIDYYGKTLFSTRSPILDISHLTWDGKTLWALGNDETDHGYIYQLDVEGARAAALERAAKLNRSPRLIDMLRYDPWTSETFIAREGVLEVANDTPHTLTLSFPDYGYVNEIPPGETRSIVPPGSSFTAQVPGVPPVQGAYGFASNMNYIWTFSIVEPET